MSANSPSESGVFEIARQIQSEEARLQYVDQACGEDEARRARILQLLENDKADSFMEKHDLAPEETIDTTARVAEEGDTIGRYKLLQKIGEGGFGVVYMAEQARPVQRKVALKVIKPGMDTKEVIGRFEAERQALAMMDHPNIAKVLDAGTTESNRPFFVMELVRGLPVTDYCDRERFGTRERLELFQTVCRAVQHAHQKGIIHRDIKPSNILVTEHDGSPVPKVIDFGVAKAINQRLTEHTIFTRFQQMVGTPMYMSPEQAELSGLDVDTRTDIYSLGVVLYELLTGTTPFDKTRFSEAAYDDIRRMIREEEPPKPSTRMSTLGKASEEIGGARRTDARKLSQLMRGELDWIVMKALEKERGRRYETAVEFADDVQRYLNQETVKACPPSILYQSRKFVRRHRSAVAAAASLLLLLCVGALGTATGWVRAVDQRREAEAQKVHAIAARDDARLAEKREAEARRIADEQRRLAENARDREIAIRREAELNRYVSDISLAHRVLNEGDLVGAELLLRQHIPESERASDFRSYEWDLLRQLCQGDALFSLPQQHEVVALAKSPDDRWIATAGVEGGVEENPAVSELVPGALTLYSAGSPMEAAVLRDGINPAVSVTFSSDGKTLITGNLDGSVDLWTCGGFRERRRLEVGHEDVVSAVAFSPDGHMFATGSRDGSVILWDYPDIDSEMLDLKFDILTLAFSPDGRTLAAGGLAESVALIDIGDRRPKFIEWKATYIRSLAFSSAENSLLAVGNENSFIWLLDTATGERTLVGKHYGFVSSVAFSPDGDALISGSMDRTVRLWGLQPLRQVGIFKGHKDVVSRAIPSADGSKLYSVSHDKTLQVWSSTPPSECDVLDGHSEWVCRAEFSRDGQWLVTGSWDGTIRLWDATSRTAVATDQVFTEDRDPHRRIMDLALHPQKDIVAVGNREGEIRIWDALSRKTKKAIHAHTNGIARLRFSPDGSRLVSAAGSESRTTPGEVKFWSTETFEEVAPPFIAHRAGVIVMEFTPDGRTLVTGGWDGTVSLWKIDRETSAPLPVTVSKIEDLTVHSGPVWGMAVSSNGRQLATTGENGVRLWDLASRDLIGQLSNSAGAPLAFTPDGRTLFAGAGGTAFKLWNVETQREMITLEGHKGFLASAAFSPPHGLILATASADSTVRLWPRLRPVDNETAR